MAEITMSKAMKIRKAMKTWLAMNQQKMYGCLTAEVRDKGTSYEEGLIAARATPFVQLDKMTVDAFITKCFDVQDSLATLNKAIENANREQHLLLIEENNLKSRLAILEKLKERAYINEGEKVETRTETKRISATEYSEMPYTVHNYELCSLDLDTMIKTTKKDLNAARDKITYLDATTKIKVNIADEWL